MLEATGDQQSQTLAVTWYRPGAKVPRKIQRIWCWRRLKAQKPQSSRPLVPSWRPESSKNPKDWVLEATEGPKSRSLAVPWYRPGGPSPREIQRIWCRRRLEVQKGAAWPALGTVLATQVLGKSKGFGVGEAGGQKSDFCGSRRRPPAGLDRKHKRAGVERHLRQKQNGPGSGTSR